MIQFSKNKGVKKKRTKVSTKEQRTNKGVMPGDNDKLFSTSLDYSIFQCGAFWALFLSSIISKILS